MDELDMLHKVLWVLNLSRKALYKIYYLININFWPMTPGMDINFLQEWQETIRQLLISYKETCLSLC